MSNMDKILEIHGSYIRPSRVKARCLTIVLYHLLHPNTPNYRAWNLVFPETHGISPGQNKTQILYASLGPDGCRSTKCYKRKVGVFFLILLGDVNSYS